MKGKGKELTSYLAVFFWVSLVAFASFFIPSFLTYLPFFKLKEIKVDGNTYIDFSLIKPVVEDLSYNILKLNEDDIEKALNDRLGNSVERVILKKSYTSEGLVLELRIKERKPVARLKTGSGYVFVDRKGEIFVPPRGFEKIKVPLVVSDSPERLKENFGRIYRYILSSAMPIKKVVLKGDRTIVEGVSKRVILPPAENISDKVFSRLNLIYNFPQENVDLRYSRFILVRN